MRGGNPRGWRGVRVLDLPRHRLAEDEPGVFGRLLALRGGARARLWEGEADRNGNTRYSVLRDQRGAA